MASLPVRDTLSFSDPPHPTRPGQTPGEWPSEEGGPKHFGLLPGVRLFSWTVSPHLQALLSLEHLFPLNLDIHESNLLENLVSGNSRFISSLNSGPTCVFNETRVWTYRLGSCSRKVRWNLSWCDFLVLTPSAMHLPRSLRERVSVQIFILSKIRHRISTDLRSVLSWFVMIMIWGWINHVRRIIVFKRTYRVFMFITNKNYFMNKSLNKPKQCSEIRR